MCYTVKIIFKHTSYSTFCYCIKNESFIKRALGACDAFLARLDVRSHRHLCLCRKENRKIPFSPTNMSIAHFELYLITSRIAFKSAAMTTYRHFCSNVSKSAISTSSHGSSSNPVEFKKRSANATKPHQLR